MASKMKTQIIVDLATLRVTVITATRTCLIMLRALQELLAELMLVANSDRITTRYFRKPGASVGRRTI